MATTIGRFKIDREIARGGQGTVYLAHDSQLDRQVAIKTLRTSSVQQREGMLREARMTSKFQHPNIVTLHDVGEHEGLPYLVYAFVEGETLAQLIKRGGQLSLVQAARMMVGILEGLGYAHQQGVLHLDIKPANVILASSGQPMLLDFGIARHLGSSSASGDLEGTPQYMSPERISGIEPDFRADIFSVGIMLYEMVTGKHAINGDNLYQILHRAANEKVDSPSAHNAAIDERLEAIILKAVAKKVEDRYPDAPAMRQALLDYLDAGQGVDEQQAKEADSTLEFLLRRMRSKSDFPALSGIIGEINNIVASDTSSHSLLARVILQDFALTNKLLKLVNTASFGNFGGTINTISKAVVILGFDTVRNIAMTLILLEFLQNKSQAADLKDEVIAAFFAGELASQLSSSGIRGEPEEAMICAMFHNLGRLLATFYFFEESRQVILLMEDQRITEEQASLKVLGISYDQMGAGIAESWNFPPHLIAGMKKLPADKIRKPRTDIERVNVTVNLANELCVVSGITDVKEKGVELKKLCARYEGVLDVSVRSLEGALEAGLKELSQRAGILGVGTAKSPLIKKIRAWSGHAETQQIEIEESEGVTLLQATPSAIAGESPSPVSAEAILSAGIQDVTNTLVDDYKLNDVLHMVLETIYRSLGFKHTLIFIRDNKKNEMSARFGFGEHVNAVIPHLRFPLAFVPDVFHLAIEKGLDIVIEDVHVGTITDKIPAWYRDNVGAPSFLLLPIMVNKKAIGLIYADMKEANSLQVSQQQLSLLRALRNQAILAIKQKM